MTRNHGKLVVVDDNPVVLLKCSELLRSAGFEVVEARNGEEGLRLARQHLPDLILLDVMLPDINGFELCRRLKAEPGLDSIFVVLLSSTQTTPGSQADGLDAGADGYIARPIENRELLARLESLLRIQRAEAALRKARDELEHRVQERTMELAQANGALRAMSLRLVEVQETERRYLARELHDEIGQLLTGIKLVLEPVVKHSPEMAMPRLQDALGLLDELTARVRQLSLDLRPQMLDDLGLLIALQWHLERYTKKTNIRTEFKHTPLAGRLPARLETAIFRVVQEALTNVARHARVDEVKVRLWVNDERAGVQVEDQGKGFDAEQGLAARTSTGLAGMRERAELLGGEFTLESSPGAGTRVTVELPLAAPAENQTLQSGGSA